MEEKEYIVRSNTNGDRYDFYPFLTKTRMRKENRLEPEVGIDSTISTMSYIMVDIEADGPIPGDYSMVSLGAVIVDEHLDKTFYGRFRPISDHYIEEALQVSGHSRAETMTFEDPEKVMLDFENWIKANSSGKPIFISDNNGFDWMFVCWYFHHFLKRNPFGYSSQNLGSLYKGLVADTFQNFKHLRQTEHTHHPVDDVKGNAEALIKMKTDLGLKIALE